ncbi:hypothetical protein N7462_011501 [Penicillium macrosclerotiorum]|uniref:uncharacterized protein n=1 Tax=Penicillium macrosclerotiorum TaxID=303699 RepID=UPI0025490128|nr:uncharacterized protein N7462_011501 [Penicillium macrosclerotiorum]KAJ5664688.1 hypothetical protein N7462_011501 [Penicillium macrosclerotiorum]
MLRSIPIRPPEMSSENEFNGNGKTINLQSGPSNRSIISVALSRPRPSRLGSSPIAWWAPRKPLGPLKHAGLRRN